eukprot:9936859-Alexandrium_andersonii.AAC.1
MWLTEADAGCRALSIETLSRSSELHRTTIVHRGCLGTPPQGCWHWSVPSKPKPMNWQQWRLMTGGRGKMEAGRGPGQQRSNRSMA